MNIQIKQETLIKLAQIGSEQRGKEQTKENAIKLSDSDFWAGNIENAVNFLETARDLFGANVSYEFNKHTLYSADITLDKAYEVITGYPKAEYEALRDKMIKKMEEDREKAIKAFDSEDLIQRGLSVVEKGKEEVWTDFVHKNENDTGIRKVKNVLEIMEHFTDNKSMEEAHKIFESEGHSDVSIDFTLTNLKYFSDKTNKELQEYIDKENAGEFYKTQDFGIGD